MRKGLGLSEQAVRRIGKALRAQSYAIDPSSGDFIMPGEGAGVQTADTEGRLQSLETSVGELQTQVQGLESTAGELQSQLQSVQTPAAAPSAPPAQQTPQWQPTSWWDRFKQVVMPDMVPGAQQPGPNKGDPSLGPYSNTYVGSKRR